MSDMKPKGTDIIIDGKEFGMRFTLSAADDIQEHFDIPLQKLADVFKDEMNTFKSIRFIITTFINADIDCKNDESGEKIPHVDETWVGRHLDVGSINELMTQIFATVSGGAPNTDGPNTKGGQ